MYHGIFRRNNVILNLRRTLPEWLAKGGISFAILLVAIMFQGVVLAQVTGGRGEISGIVSDSAGAAIPNASVAVANTETGVVVNTKSNDVGLYIVRQLLPGNYQVTCEAKGFKKFVRSGITVNADITVANDIKLDLGSSTQEVVVNGQETLLNTESGADPQILDTLTLASVPVSGGNATMLIKVQPNIQAGDPQNQYMGGSLHANGANQSFGTAGQYKGNEFTLDGAPNISNGNAQSYPSFADEVQEISSDTAGFSATVGHTMGVSVNTVGKNGTNHFHGTVNSQYDDHTWQPLSHFSRVAYENNVTYSPTCAPPNENSDACNALKKKYGQVPLHDNLIDFTVGGPVIIPKLLDGHNKLFFFVGYIYNYYPSSLTCSGTVPTDQEKNGDFSDLPCVISGSGGTDPNGFIAMDRAPTQRRATSDSTRSMIPLRQFLPVRLIPDTSSVRRSRATRFPEAVFWIPWRRY